MKLRLIDIDYPEDPHLNLAIDEAIFMEVLKGNSSPTFRFYRNNNAVIIGCFQLADQEVDLDYAKSKNIKIAKRFTGGGAVYHDMGNLNYSVISKDVFDIGMNVEKLFSTMIKGAVSSLKVLGIEAAQGGLNDVSVNGKKVLGSAATIKADTILFHAAILVNVNLNTLATVLKVPGIKLKDKGVKTVLERVSNIRDLSGKEISHVKEALLVGYSKELNFEYEIGTFTERENHLIKKLHKEKYLKHEWNMGREFINIDY
jgi:lipoate---protein ligase